MLKQRFITALILAPLALLGIFFLPPTALAAAIAIVYVMAAHEWSRLISEDRQRRIVITIALGGLLLMSFAWLPVSETHLAPHVLWLFVFAGAWWLGALGLVLSYPKSAAAWRSSALAKFAFGVITLLPFFWALILLRGLWPDKPTSGAAVVIYVMALVWAADSGAYFAGKRFGKNKLAPSVSPGKTIEGLFGGILAATLVIVAVIIWGHMGSMKATHLLIASYLTVFSSALGDLLESMLKREAGIKDSGRLLPGHGGVLDRIDSLTAALPVFTLCYLLWFA